MIPSSLPARCLPALALLVGLSTRPGQPQDDGPPSARRQTDLVEAYLAADPFTRDGMAEQDRILAELERVPPLTDSQVKSWKKKIFKLAARGRELEKKSGQRWFWEEEERGKYIVGGETKKPKGLMIGMHGGGVGSGDAWSSHGAYNGAADSMKWLAIFPEVLEKTEHGWTDSGTEEFVLSLVDAALRTWDIDPDHVYFAGHSMGGYGSWTLGAHHADRVAALAPSAGAPTPYYGADGKVNGIADGVVPNLRNVPMVVYQSDDDPQVPPDANRAAALEVEKARETWGGYEFEYWEVTGQGHGMPPGGTKAHLEKIAEHERNTRPERVVWQPALTWKRQFYWLWWQQPARNALVVADWDREGNRIVVDCPVNPRGLEVLLDGEMLDLEAEVVVLLGEQEVHRGPLQASLATLVKTAAAGDPRRTFSVSVPLAR